MSPAFKTKSTPEERAKIADKKREGQYKKLGLKPKPVLKPKVKLKPLLWDVINVEQLEGTLFTDLRQVKIDYGAFEQQFQQTVVAAKKKSGENTGGKDKEAEKIRFVKDDIYRRIYITLKGKKLTGTKLDVFWEAVLRVDREKIVDGIEILTSSSLSSLRGACPPEEEMTRAIETFEVKNGDPKGLDEVEAFLYKLFRLPLLRDRLQCMEGLFNIEEKFLKTLGQIEQYKQGIEDIQKSDGLQIVMSLVLEIGNYCNAGGNRGRAHGYVHTILASLFSYKDTDGNDLYQYIYKYLDKNYPEIAHLWSAKGLNVLPFIQSIDLGDLLRSGSKFKKFVDTLNKVRRAPSNVEHDNFYEATAEFAAQVTDMHEKLNAACSDLSKCFAELNATFGAHTSEKEAETFFQVFSTFLKSYESAAGRVEKQKRELHAKTELTRRQTLRTMKHLAKNGGKPAMQRFRDQQTGTAKEVAEAVMFGWSNGNGKGLIAAAENGELNSKLHGKPRTEAVTITDPTKKKKKKKKKKPSQTPNPVNNAAYRMMTKNREKYSGSNLKYADEI